MPDAIEYVSEEKAAKISRNPDWQCSFCGSLNSDDLNICKNCGATKEDSERNYFEIRQQEEEKKRKKEEKKEAHQKSTAKSVPKKKRKKEETKEITDEKSSSLSGNLCCHYFRNDVLSGTESKKCNH